MKIGIISDIHGYLRPLAMALDIFKQAEVDQILCAGDLVDGGDYANEVVQRIQQKGIPCVEGNHDHSVLTEAWWQILQEEDDIAGRFRLTSASYEFVTTLPKALYFEWEGKKICLAHGAPWNNWEYIYAFSEPALVHRLVDEAASDFIILGHTHVPMQLLCKGTYILNAGSVAMNRDTLRGRTCGILTIPDFKFEIHYLGTDSSRTLETQIIP